MKWNLFDTGFNSGRFNMDFDVQLVQRKLNNQAILRFYRWKPYCISIGLNQSIESIDIEKAKEDDIDIVRRPTGGRAILHAEELTYSVAYPANDSYSPKTLYHEVNLALKNGLEIYHPSLQKLELEHKQPQFQSFYKENKSTLCFAVSAKSEINFMGKKLVGSAQRKIGNLVLQHGSILCGKFHLNLVDYLNVHNNEKEKIRNEITQTTTELSSITNDEIDYEKLTISVKTGFEKQFKVCFEDNMTEAVLN
jgi:lipoate-protein ligase A